MVVELSHRGTVVGSWVANPQRGATTLPLTAHPRVRSSCYPILRLTFMNGSPTLVLATHRYIVVCISGYPSDSQAGTGGGAFACHLILVNIISGHRRRRLLNQPPASLGRISVIPVDADICWGKPSRRLSVMLGGLSSRSAECLLPSPRGDTERLPWHTVMATGLSCGGGFILHRHPLMAD